MAEFLANTDRVLKYTYTPSTVTATAAEVDTVVPKVKVKGKNALFQIDISLTSFIDSSTGAQLSGPIPATIMPGTVKSKSYGRSMILKGDSVEVQEIVLTVPGTTPPQTVTASVKIEVDNPGNDKVKSN